MTIYQPTAEHACSCASAVSRSPRWWTVLAAQAAAGIVYAVAVPLGGVDLTARSGGTTRTVDLGTVLGVTLLAGVVAVGWMIALRHLTGRPDRNWAVSAGVVLVVSLLGPASATSVAAGLTLACMHIAVGGVLALGSLPWQRARHG